jgi:hypothetical protein
MYSRTKTKSKAMVLEVKILIYIYPEEASSFCWASLLAYHDFSLHLNYFRNKKWGHIG